MISQQATCWRGLCPHLSFIGTECVTAFCCSRGPRGRPAWLDQEMNKQKNKNEERKAEKRTPSIELHKSTRTRCSPLSSKPRTHARTCTHSPHRSDYKSDYANFGLREKPQPPSQCGNSVNKWSTKHKVLKGRITKWLSFLSPHFWLFFLTQCLLHIHTHRHTYTHNTCTLTHRDTHTPTPTHKHTWVHKSAICLQNSIAAQCLHRWAV